MDEEIAAAEKSETLASLRTSLARLAEPDAPTLEVLGKILTSRPGSPADLKQFAIRLAETLNAYDKRP